PIVFRILAIAQGRGNVIVSIEHHNFAEQVRNYHAFIALVEVARHLCGSEDEVHMLAIERESLKPAVATVGYDQQRCLRARIDPQAVRTVELVITTPQSTEGADEFSF